MIVFDQVVMPSSPGADESEPINLAIPTDRRLAILCADTFSQVSLVNVLAAISVQVSGRIIRNSRLSFPVGFVGGFSRLLSTRMNVSRAAAMYGADDEAVVNFVRKYTGLGPKFDEPMESLPKLMHLHVASVLAYAIPFDAYLLNGALGHPPRYLDKYTLLFEQRMQESGAIFVTGDVNAARQHCEIGAIFHKGSLVFYNKLEEAIATLGRLRPAAIAPKPLKERLQREEEDDEGEFG